MLDVLLDVRSASMDNALNVRLNLRLVKALQASIYAFKNVDLLVRLVIEINATLAKLVLF